jgi:hypothetical protein
VQVKDCFGKPFRPTKKHGCFGERFGVKYGQIRNSAGGMFTSGRSRTLAAIVPFFFVGPLLAQRYAEQDHHVFHRPSPAVTQTKRASGTSATAARTPVSATGSAAHPTDTTRPRDVTLNNAPASGAARNSK